MASRGRLIVDLTSGAIACEQALIADRPLLRMRGLLGRSSLQAGEGMLLHPAPSIHTAFMRFPVDVLFLDARMRVIKAVANLKPWRMAAAARAWGALELAAGEISARGIGLGHRLGVFEIDDRLGPFKLSERLVEIGGRQHGPTDRRQLPYDDENRSDDPQAQAHPRDGHASAGDGAQREGCASVLIASSDRRFRSVVATLLSQRGRQVILASGLRDVAETAAAHSVEVVLIDAGRRLAAAAEARAELETLRRRIGVVVVDDDGLPGLAAMPVLPKWAPFEHLYEALERAQAQAQER
jgi:uncharacterized membrane protein (UPF0127 family)/CheY-like chemotaxis protein